MLFLRNGSERNESSQIFCPSHISAVLSMPVTLFVHSEMPFGVASTPSLPGHVLSLDAVGIGIKLKDPAWLAAPSECSCRSDEDMRCCDTATKEP